jgi:hypothetical protein
MIACITALCRIPFSKSRHSLLITSGTVPLTRVRGTIFFIASIFQHSLADSLGHQTDEASRAAGLLKQLPSQGNRLG